MVEKQAVQSRSKVVEFSHKKGQGDASTVCCWLLLAASTAITATARLKQLGQPASQLGSSAASCRRQRAGGAAMPGSSSSSTFSAGPSCSNSYKSGNISFTSFS